MKTLVVGSAHLDTIAYATDTKPRDAIGYARFFAGGTAFNVAAWLSHHRQAPRLFTYLRKDSYLSDAIFGVISRCGVKTPYVFRENIVCGHLLDDSAFIAHIDANTHSLIQAISAVNIGKLDLPDHVRETSRLRRAMEWADICVIDCNLSPSTIGFICREARADRNVAIVVAGVSAPKIRRYVELRLDAAHRADLLCANHEEIASLFTAATDRNLVARLSGTALQPKDGQRICERANAQRVTVSNDKGFFLASPEGVDFFPAPRTHRDRIVSTTGAGDALLAGMVAAYARARASDGGLRLADWRPDQSAQALINEGIAGCLLTHGATPLASLCLRESQASEEPSFVRQTWLRIRLKFQEIVEERLIEYSVIGLLALVLYLLGRAA